MNDNLAVWTSDWHVVSNDSESGGVGETHPTDAAAVAAHIASLEPAVCFDTGDCKDHYGASGTTDEHDNYISQVQATLPYATVRAGVTAALPILPGNHDELNDYNDGSTTNDFSPFDGKFWSAPYHWEVDWQAPRVRFIAAHSYIHHSTDGHGGFAHIDQTEIDWVQGRIDNLRANWQAIIVTHFPAVTAFGNHIRFVDDTYYAVDDDNPWTDLLAANSARIACYLNGHRHANMNTTTLDGITHINGPGMAYTIGNSRGGWVPITYDPDTRTLTFDLILGPPGSYTRKGGYTPIDVTLPALRTLAGVVGTFT